MGEDTPIQSVRAVDSHCHISDSRFDSDREAVVEDCWRRKILLVDSALTKPHLAKSLVLTQKYEHVKLTVGWEPANLNRREALEFRDLVFECSDKVLAVGEVGLDRFLLRDREEWSRQEQILGIFMEAADKLGKPLVVHSRSAGKACIELLLSAGFSSVLMHAYDGSSHHAVEAAKKGFLFSVPPSVVRSEQKLKLVKRLGLSSLILESDAPVLAPVRGERNVPQNVFVSAQKIAELKGVSVEEVLRQTTATALRFYRLL
jgi:TatD DNase family protein